MTMPKLEVGATPTDWIEGKSGFVEDSGIAAKLLRTGLDIENGKITATADRFEVRNNSGVVTASVNDNGLLEVYAGLFSGFVRKKLTVITPENIGQYTIPSAQLGYVVFDFAAAGSFVRFEGDFRAVYGSDYPTIILPYTNYSSSTRPNSVPFAQAVPYLDQKFIVINKANTSVVIVGGGTINRRGSTTIGTSSLPNEVGTNQEAIVTCTLKTTTKSSGNSCTIVWDGYVYG